ncbi:DUF1766-domain-containing protein [Polychaeton citri CBS 116435]|uniref:DUF1766-domain-containing protein n=1 Tax=Polychaeton citri CBS 116435 TaxID=1314669 RepID=A0A9P4UMS2_9PEZI|nr:DUF1766-domain-containing protein [Polychaeton citri CBS 116435]
MPHFPHAPEALLGRNDSKNPGTTCRGITSSGRPCRRALASRKAAPSRRDWAATSTDIVDESLATNHLCWQHKSQAEKLTDRKTQLQGEGRKQADNAGVRLLPTLQEKSSIDTLMQRLDIQDLTGRKRRGRHGGREARNTIIHDTWSPERFDSRTNTVPKHRGNSLERPQTARTRPQQRRKTPGFWASLCCIAEQDDEDNYLEVARHRRRTRHSQPEMAEVLSRPALSSSPAGPSNIRQSTHASLPTLQPKPSDLFCRPPARRSTSNPHTTRLLSLMPQHLSPATTSALMAELVKPISPHDEEGYIYIFWLTPQSRNSPSEAAARSLLGSPSHSGQRRRVSDVMTEFSYDGSDFENSSTQNTLPATARGGSTRRTIKLKIGRANNITRRMNEWQRQCGHALTLVRWYPYVSSVNSGQTTSPPPARMPNRQPQQSTLYPDLTQPSSESPEGTERRFASATSMVRKVPYVKRVERLIHIELAEKQVKRNCGTCGKEHREWFEAEASQAGIRGIDECIRRWVNWAERSGSTDVAV